MLQHILGLGDGWAPAVLDTLAEYTFIRWAIRSETLETIIWVGGSTNGFNPRASIWSQFPHFFPNETGSIAHKKIMNEIMTVDQIRPIYRYFMNYNLGA